MKPAQMPSGPAPWLLRPLVSLMRGVRRRLRALFGRAPGPRHGPCDVCGALLLVGAITGAAVLGAPPLLTVGGGVGVAVLFVGARSWVVVQEQQAA